MHAQLGKILDKRYKKTKKPNLPLLKSLEQKQGTVHSPHSCPGGTHHHLSGGETT